MYSNENKYIFPLFLRVIFLLKFSLFPGQNELLMCVYGKAVRVFLESRAVLRGPAFKH